MATASAAGAGNAAVVAATSLAADCAAEGNQLSQPLRAQIISLSLFVDRHSSQVMRNGAALDVLIEINRTIMQGLSPAAATVPA